MLSTEIANDAYAKMRKFHLSRHYSCNKLKFLKKQANKTEISEIKCFQAATVDINQDIKMIYAYGNYEHI